MTSEYRQWFSHKGPERESPNQRETPIVLLDGAAGG